MDNARSASGIRLSRWFREKSIILMEDNKYSFLVAKDANKIEIKHAVETLFNVKVLDVATRNLKGKSRGLSVVIGAVAPDTKQRYCKSWLKVIRLKSSATCSRFGKRRK